jgi:AraC-like DNA-binding protein
MGTAERDENAPTQPSPAQAYASRQPLTVGMAASCDRHGHVPGPDLELVEVPSNGSFKVWSHGYPFRTVRWHFHPEYEIHLITATTGRAFVGDHIGTFQPGNLVLTGPNLPHNWISDVPVGAEISQRCLVLQFTEEFAAGVAALFPEMAFLQALLAEAARGVEFTPQTGCAARPVMDELLTTAGGRRIELLFALLGLLQADDRRRPLASAGYCPVPMETTNQPLNHVLAHIGRNLGHDLRETDLAALSGYSPSAFCRAFQRHTGMTFVSYVNGLRIGRACELLVGSQRRITDICFEVGFSNLSNFNRQFLTQKSMPPSAFRNHHRGQAALGSAMP